VRELLNRLGVAMAPARMNQIVRMSAWNPCSGRTIEYPFPCSWDQSSLFFRNREIPTNPLILRNEQRLYLPQLGQKAQNSL